MKDFGVVKQRPDGSFEIVVNGMFPYHVPDEGDFKKLYQEILEYLKLNPDKVQQDKNDPIELPVEQPDPNNDPNNILNIILGMEAKNG